MFSKQLPRLLSRNRNICSQFLQISEEINEALTVGKQSVVALESTIITHGMPYPTNIQCALEVEKQVRTQGAIPATIAVINGRIKVGLSKNDLEFLGDTDRSRPIKISRRDFAYALAEKLNGGTTVAGTLIACQQVGIHVFATGGLFFFPLTFTYTIILCHLKGIGGVHRDVNDSFDISADLNELGHSNVAVISSGVKSILDISKTLEYLETQGVFVATLGENHGFPAFYSRSSSHQAPYRVQDTYQAAKIVKSHLDLGLNSGLLFAVPVPEAYACDPEKMEFIIQEALRKASEKDIKGKARTPFLLEEIARASSGNSLETNVALIKNNAKVASEIALKLQEIITESGISSEKNARPIVIGGSNLDCMVRLQQTNETVKLDGRIHMCQLDYNPGGVGRNICEALEKLGQPCHFFTAVGDDYQGKIVLDRIPKTAQKYVKTLKNHRTAQCIVVLDKMGDCSFLMGDMDIHKEISIDVLENDEDVIKGSPLMVMDGNLSLQTMDKALKIAEKYKIPVFYEPTDTAIARKPFQSLHWKSIKFITPNVAELMDISEHFQIPFDQTLSDLSDIASLASSLSGHIDNVIVTLGPRGVLLASKGQNSPRHYPADDIPNLVNVSGAGDCFASGFIAALLEKRLESECVSVGLAAARMALLSASPVPKKMFDRNDRAWQLQATSFILK
ncbi:hypothetical protein ABEB36_011960 [Hypothenemus hampei]|uniref:Carbohydrate kinase PfkB domain-containing protein n=1 Tax=Hypothenemus hampei TaxID=57062 RepID=A0ABD1EDX7_HYPHA